MSIKDFIDEIEDDDQEECKEITKHFLKLPKTQQEAILTAAVEYERMNQQEKLVAAHRNKMLRPIVEGAANAHGIEDQNGSLHLVMKDSDGNTTEIIRQKKVKRELNNFAAERLLKKKKLYDACMMQVVTWELDEEKIIEAYESGKISAMELDSIMNEKITWATKVETDVPDVQKLAKERKEIEKMEIPEIES
jgi:hypothetical protein